MEPDIIYTNESAYNVRDGHKHIGRYSDQTLLGATFDLAKIASIHGASFRLSIANRNGDDVTNDVHLSTRMSVEEIYGRGNVTRLTEIFYRQSFQHKTIELKIGHIPMCGDIFAFGCDFHNLTFCGTPPAYKVYHWYTWPISKWG